MNRFVLGDCLDVLPSLPAESADLVLTDPPYLVNYRDRSGRSIANDDAGDWLAPAFGEIFRVLKRDAFCISFYGWNRVDQFFAAWKAAGFRPVGHVVFAKRYSSKSTFLAYRHESAFLLAKGRPAKPAKPIPDVLPWQYSGNTLHPTQKPISSLLPLIESFSQPGDLVLDPFAGSGSTCAAAQQLGRRYVGIELDPGFHATASRRLATPVKAAA